MATLSKGGGRGREGEENGKGEGDGKRPRLVISLVDSSDDEAAGKNSSNSKASCNRADLPILPFYLNRVWVDAGVCTHMVWAGCSLHLHGVYARTTK
jgi:hypothetical protein